MLHYLLLFSEHIMHCTFAFGMLLKSSSSIYQWWEGLQEFRKCALVQFVFCQRSRVFQLNIGLFISASCTCRYILYWWILDFWCLHRMIFGIKNRTFEVMVKGWLCYFIFFSDITRPSSYYVDKYMIQKI